MEVQVRCFGEQRVQDNGLVVRGYRGWEELEEGGDPRFTSVLRSLSTDLAIVRDPIDADIVHTHTWYAALAGFMARVLYPVKFVATVHSLEPRRPWKEEQLGRAFGLSSWVEKVALESADRVVAVSGAVKQDVLECFAVPEEKVVVIPNGIDCDKWREVETTAAHQEYGITGDYVLFVGRTSRQKGLRYLVEAADYLRDDVLVVCCAGVADVREIEEEMERRVAGRKNVRWIRKVLSEEERIELYSGARVFVCPSIYEPFGIINLEAMACKTPVVASDVGGIREVVIPEENGMLVEPAQPRQLAEAVNRLLADPGLARRLGENGRRLVEEHYGWSQVARQTKQMYESLLAG
jgi:glycogen synthase